MTQRHKITWVLVGDGVHAQLYLVKSVIPLRIETLASGHFHGRGEAAPHDNHGGQSIKFDAHGPHAELGRHPDPHRLDKDIFVEHLGEYISEAGRDQKFDELIVVAPARALGEFRRSIAPTVAAKIRLEIPGEWTKLPHVEIENHLLPHFPQARTSP